MNDHDQCLQDSGVSWRSYILLTISSMTPQLVEHPHSNIFLLKTNLLQLIIDIIKYLSYCLYISVFPSVVFSAIICYLFFWSMCSDSSADSVIRSRAASVSGRLLSSADAFTAIDKSCKHQYTILVVKLLVTDCSTTLSIEDFFIVNGSSSCFKFYQMPIFCGFLTCETRQIC